MIRSSILVIGFVSFFVLLCPLQVSVGCGPELRFEGYSFINQNIVNRDSEYAPYFFYFDQFYDHYQRSQEAQTKSNLEEWQERFCDQVTTAELGQVIYETNLSELKSLQTAIRNKKYPIPPRLRTNGFAQHLKSHQCQETIDYLVFAKECEPHVTRSGDSWEAPGRNLVMMDALLEDGTKAFRRTKSNYIRLRYAYQLIRLAHYKKDYEGTLDLYEYLMPKVDPTESLLNDWIMGHRAGAMLKLGQRVEASYLYSLIFDRCPGKRESAFRSFRIETDEEWEACLLLCQDNRERATLFALRATSESSKAAEEMASMYDLYPQSEHLELLLVKEVRKLERDLLGLDFNNRKRENKQFFGVPRKRAGEYLVKLQEFVNKVVEEGKVARVNLWRLASGYLEYLTGDFYAANITFGKLQGRLVDQPLLREQLLVFQLALRINSFEEIGAEEEGQVAQIIMEDTLYRKFHDFSDFLNDRLSYVYKEQDDVGKAFRCQYNLSDLRPNPQLDILENLLAVCEQEEKTKFERALVSKADGTLMKNEILDMIGNWYLSRGKPEAALEYLRRIPRNDWDFYQFNPFVDFMQDCVECPMPDSMERYNKVEVFEKIFELEYKAKADFEHGAEHLYRLGVAYYNMSYFGHSWQLMDYYRSGSSWYYDKDRVFFTYLYPFGNRENQDLSLALKYFEKARDTSKDLELKAKASYMAARCEQNSYFVSKDFQPTRGGNQIPNVPAAYRRNFTLLKNNYSNTDFYQSVIEECKYFEAFVRR